MLAGLVLFAVGALVLGSNIAHVQDRFDIWLDPFARNAPEGAGQVRQSLFAQADGGLFGQGLGESLLKLPGPFAPDCQQPFPECGSILPTPHTDFIFAVITMELGLFGACGVILIYALIAARGFKTAVMAPDGFSKLLAAGLTAIFVLQAFVIIGGVTKVIPLTGVTLPFVSFGGSSIVANMILLALLLLVSDRARRPPPERRGRGPRHRGCRLNRPIVRIYVLVLLLLATLVYFTSKWAVFDAEELEANRDNRRPLIEEQQIPRGSIATADGVLVAESLPEGGGRNPVYVRRYPQGSLFGNPVGYSYVEVERTGIELGERPADRRGERVRDDHRPASRPAAGGRQHHAHARLRGPADRRPRACSRRSASRALAALVAIEPATGGARDGLDSGFDPNEVQNPESFKALTGDESAPLLNRPTQSTYPPGSTMKVVTAAAALDRGVRALDRAQRRLAEGDQRRELQTPVGRASATST